LRQTREAAAPIQTPVDAALDSVALIFTTSGTTGTPKLIPVTHENLLVTADKMRQWFNLSPGRADKLLWTIWSFAGDWLNRERALAPNPRSRRADSDAGRCRAGFGRTHFYHIRDNWDSQVNSRDARKPTRDGRQNAAVVQFVSRRSYCFRSPRLLWSSHKDFIPCAASVGRRRRAAYPSACQLADMLTCTRPVFLLHPYLDPGPKLTIEEMARSYVPHLLAAQPSGAFRLAGHCNGGLLAWELAFQLDRLGRQVELVVLINTLSLNARLALRIVAQLMKFISIVRPRGLANKSNSMECALSGID